MVAVAPSQVAHGLVFVLAGFYSLAGLSFVCSDYEVVQGCHSGHNIIWSMSLWHYCVASIIAGPAAVLLMLLSPVHKMEDTLRLMAAMRDHPPRMMNGKGPNPNFANQSVVPDWTVMCLGSWLVFLGFFLMVFCYWGYAELWLTEDFCKDQGTAFKETDLWAFGCVTFTLQLLVGIVLLVAGVSCWFAPLALEMAGISCWHLRQMPAPVTAGGMTTRDHGHYGTTEPRPGQLAESDPP